MIDRFLRKLSVRTRIVGGFLILIVLLTLSVPVSVANYNFLVERLRQVTNIEAAANRALLLASTRIANSRTNLMRYIDNQVPSPTEALDDTDTATSLLTGALEQGLIRAPDQQQDVTTVVQALAEYKTLITDIEAARKQNSEQDNARQIFQAYRLGNDSGQRIEQIVKDSEDRIAAANALVESDAQGRIWFLIGSYLVALLIGLILTLLIQRSITRPVASLRNAAEAFRQGQLDATSVVTGSDELSLLAQTFNQMTAQLSRSYLDLEQRVAARTEQLRASADVGRTAASALEPDELMRTVVNLITDRFGFYYAAVFLVEPSGRYAVLREATGEAGRNLKERGHQLEVNGQSMVGYAITRRHARIALDVGAEAVHFANPLLPDTRSEIALPLSVGDRVLGALDVQSTQGAAFDEASAAVLQAMADQIAIALNNAFSYTETQALVRRSRALFAASREVGRLQTDLAETIRATLHAAADTLNYDHWCVLTFNEIRTGLVAIAAHNWPGSEAVLDVQSQADHPLVYTAQQDTELFINESYDLRLGQLQIADLRNLISVPIKTRETLVGVLAFCRTLDSELTEGDLEVGHSLANLIAIAIENYNLIETSQRTLRELDEVNRSLTGQSWEKFARRQGEHGLIWVSRSDQLQPQVLPEVSEALSLGRIATRVLEDRQQLGVAVPIKLRDVPVGALRLIVPQRTWNSEMATALDSIAGHIAQASENARLIAVTEERLTRERALAEATEKVRQRSEIEAILQTATTELARYLNASHITVHMAAETQPAAGNGEHVGR